MTRSVQRVQTGLPLVQSRQRHAAVKAEGDVPNQMTPMAGVQADPDNDVGIVVFDVYYDGVRNGLSTGVLKQYLDTPTLYHVRQRKENESPNAFAINRIREHVQQHGMIDELMLYGHGDGKQNIHNTLGTELANRQFLEDLVRLQTELGRPIARRIVMGGCGSFIYLNAQEQKRYQ